MELTFATLTETIRAPTLCLMILNYLLSFSRLCFHLCCLYNTSWLFALSHPLLTSCIHVNSTCLCNHCSLLCIRLCMLSVFSYYIKCYQGSGVLGGYLRNHTCSRVMGDVALAQAVVVYVFSLCFNYIHSNMHY